MLGCLQQSKRRYSLQESTSRPIRREYLEANLQDKTGKGLETKHKAEGKFIFKPTYTDSNTEDGISSVGWARNELPK